MPTNQAPSTPAVDHDHGCKAAHRQPARVTETRNEEQLIADRIEREYAKLEWHDAPRVDLGASYPFPTAAETTPSGAQSATRTGTDQQISRTRR